VKVMKFTSSSRSSIKNILVQQISFHLFGISTATSAVILKTEQEHHRISSLSGDNILGAGVRIGRGEDAVAVSNGNIMDSAQSAMMKQTDYVV
ncbi:unnamed protein product, partial [Heterotrigona itama]